MITVRLAAARALMAVDRRESTLGAALEFARQPFDAPRDRALLVEITTGSLRWRSELDALISAASRRSVQQIDPRALMVLRMGAYQLRHLDRVPEHAVVNESVETVRSLGAPRAAGFVNAVLRSMIRRGPALALPGRPGAAGSREAQLAYLSTTLSHPGWLAARWIDRFGFEAAERWCQFNNASPDITVRSAIGLPGDEVIARLKAAGIEAEPAPFARDAVRLKPGALGRVPDDLRAALWVQDEGSQLVARAAATASGERVLDLCAAPGGKSLVMASDMGLDRESGSLLVAADARPSRTALLTETFSRANLPVPVVRLDARAPLPFTAHFDCVVVDVPCSGLGTLRREPDLKWSRMAADLPVFAAEQQRMITSAAEAVRPGGRLVYATCSSEPEENTAVVDAFLSSDSRFRGVRCHGVAPELVDARGHLVTRPDTHGLEAFFAAVLVRQQAP